MMITATVTIEISYSSNTPKMIADGIQRVLVSRLDDYIYALENIPLERRLYDLLKLRRMKISVAESFTGGVFLPASFRFPAYRRFISRA